MAKSKQVVAAVEVPVAAEVVVAAPEPILVLVGVAGKAPRAGTASAATHAVLLGSRGNTRTEVLAALADAERAWHDEQGRIVKAISPAGWLKTHGAQWTEVVLPA